MYIQKVKKENKNKEEKDRIFIPDNINDPI